MSSTKFIKNQIKSLLRVRRKLNGEFAELMLNKSIRSFNHRKQDYIHLMLCNELLLRKSIEPKAQFQSMTRQESFGQVLTSITEFKIDTEVIDKFNQFSHMYGNKHLDERTKATLSRSKGEAEQKYFTQIRFWKITMHMLQKSETFQTIVSYNDLKYFYETQIFDFFEQNPNIPTPNLVELLGEYLKYLFMGRTMLGHQVFWRFPIYRKPLEMGDKAVVSANQLQINKIYDMIGFYQKLQERIDEFNDMIIQEENVPLSLNKQQRKKIKKKPPVLTLRPKHILETSLPLFNDLNVFTVASTEQEIVLQRPKYLDKVL